MLPKRVRPSGVVPISAIPTTAIFSGSEGHVRYLIKDGLPMGANFERANDVVCGGVVFYENTPLFFQGKYWHHGRIINYVFYSDDFSFNPPWDKHDGTTTTTNTITFPAAGGYMDYIPVIEASHHVFTFTLGIVGNPGDQLSIAMADYATGEPNGTTIVTTTGNFQVESAFCDLSGWITSKVNAITPNATFTLSQASIRPNGYPMYPISIPTFGTYKAIDTAASDGTGHGLTWPCPIGSGLRDCLNGKADGAELMGEELIHWTAGNSAVLSEEADRLRVDSVTEGYALADQFAAVTPGERYQLSGNGYHGNVPWTMTAWDGVTVFGDVNYTEDARQHFVFTPATASVRVRLLNNSPNTAAHTHFDDISLRQISPASGVITLINLTIIPPLEHFITNGNLIILATEDGTDILRVNGISGLFQARDNAATVADSPSPFVAGQAHTVEIHFDASGMWVVLDGISGVKAPFSGTFDTRNMLNYAYLNEDMVSIGHLTWRQT